MSMVLSYDDTLSRVHIAVTGLAVTADSVTIERSTDLVTWTTVRGGTALTTLGAQVFLDDYEFSANVQNFYRAIAYDTAPALFVTGGPGTSGNNTSLVPALPSGRVAGDLILIQASIRNSPTGQPVAPFGYTTVVDAVNMKVFGRIVTGGEVAPTVTFTGGTAGADTLAQSALFRNTDVLVGNVATQLNPSQQNIPQAPLTVPARGMMVVMAVWKQDDWTTATLNPPPFAPIAGNGVISTVGNDASQSWAYWSQSIAKDVNINTTTVVGGGSAISRAATVAFFHKNLVTNTDTGSITPVIDSVWMKVINRPFLNRPLQCILNPTPIVRRARNGIFPIVGRSFPIAVTDVRLSREVTIDIITQTTTQRMDMDLILATGDTYFFQSPPGHPMPTIYAAAGDTTELRPLLNRTCNNDWRRFTLPLTEIAAPASDVVGSIGTWQTVVNTYATWSAVLAAHPTWADLLTLVGSPSDVIVP